MHTRVGDIGGAFMNPIRHCVDVCVHLGCADMYCMFSHRNGVVAKTPRDERVQEKYGYTRCVHEWEITAVR